MRRAGDNSMLYLVTTTRSPPWTENVIQPQNKIRIERIVLYYFTKSI
jgi:hypothetical protein